MLDLRSVRGRLWAALTLLSLAVLAASAVTWFALQRVDARLQDLHQETLRQVTQALDLSKRSADLATSAPYLLHQRSNFLLEQEGAKLLTVLDQVQAQWPQAHFGQPRAGQFPVAAILDDMATGVIDLIAASRLLDAVQADIRTKTATLSGLRNAATAQLSTASTPASVQLNWWSLQSMSADALNAAYAGNLIGVGEEQRHYLGQRDVLQGAVLLPDQAVFLNALENSVWGPSGVFELRRQELSRNLAAQNALFRIRSDANQMSALASDFANQSEAFLARERDASSRTIRVTRITVAAISAISLALAITAAIYVSRYVTFNISRVSKAMVRLANGDRESVLPRRFANKDEIGDLFRSFRMFRANALRLDRSNRQLDQRNALFEKVFANISDGIVITDPSGRITARNPAFAKILHLPKAAVVGGTFVARLSESPFASATVEAGLRPDHRGFCELVSADGQVLELRASALPDDGRVWLLADVTERRKMSDRLQQIDRIETLGKVAGDTAHDFANILSTIRTHAHLLEGKHQPNTSASLSAIGNAVDFGASLTDRLLAFARKQSLTPETVDLNALIAGMTDLVEISLKPQVTLDLSLPDAPVFVLVDPGQLESALFNLLLNANNAIDGAGSIAVSLILDETNQAKIAVTDTGQGMTEEILARAIEPFFTTRGSDGGTGLGLSIVYGFIRQTGGNLQIESVVGQGTQIEVTLPLAPVPMPPSVKGTARSVLLVEDDPKTRRSLAAQLERIGFLVTAQAGGQDALALLSQQAFDLLLSDLDLGGAVDGTLLAVAAGRASPRIPAIIMSGKSTGAEFVPPGTVFIQKPVTDDNLATALSNVGLLADHLHDPIV